jgi:hypothetical protein
MYVGRMWRATSAMLGVVSKKRQSRRAERGNEWAVSVRLNDGKVLYWCGEEAERRGQDWAGESQAFRFETEEAAEQYAEACSTNSRAWEYRAVRLKQSR